ncbi:MAG: 7-cyano-7-deazaguanine synthase [Candidatus Omnitrophica bacterium]|nr:7-cyano-7-deazaguanine synthase [Candidatus Omnitrophota bacterium]
MTGDRKLCKRCVLPESKPDIWLNADGVCNVCVEYEKTKACLRESAPLESDFIKLLDKHKSKGDYDCLVMCSGGKDSTAALYYMKERYKCRPLAFTFDHHFETEEALDNIKNAVDILGVDFLFFKTDYMKDMFSEILETESRAVICHPCSIWYMDLTFKMAARFDIPIIIAGWTKGQSAKQTMMSKCGCNIHQTEFVSMAKATAEFLDDYTKRNPKYKDFPKSMEEVLSRAKKRHKSVVLSPHWFLPHDASKYVETIKKELNWKMPKLSYPAGSTNCALNFLSVHHSMKNFGYTHYHVEMSKLIREGIMAREDALKSLEIDFDEKFLDSIAKTLTT